LPESWIPPDHLLDLRSKVRLRHTLVDQRGEWQQRMRAVLYHHGLPARSELHLLSSEGLAWLEQAQVPAAAREQIAVAIAMTEALGAQIAPLDRQLRAYARRQPGCRALMAHYGIGELTSVAILAELGDCQRFSSSRQAVRYSGLDITVYQSDARRSPRSALTPGPARAALGALRSRASRTTPRQPGPRLLRPGRRTTRRQPRLCRDRPQTTAPQLPHPARTRRGGLAARMNTSLRAKAFPHPDTSRPAPDLSLPTPPGGRPPENERPQRSPQREQHPITIMSPTNRSSTQISMGARAHAQPDHHATRNHSPPMTNPALDKGALHR
jgi:hypothetical protein